MSSAPGTSKTPTELDTNGVSQDPDSDVRQQTDPEALNGKGLSDQTNYVPRRKIISIFLACATVGTTELLDETMIALALPYIGSEFRAGSQIAWIATAYFTTSTACQLLYGRLSDIWSRKATLYALMTVFFVGNLASAFSKNLTQLIVFRAITGLGGGGMPTLGQVIVSDTVSLRERGKYQGILGISVAIANGVGPLIGGAFSQKSTWRWIFRLTLPMTAISACCVYFFMPLKQVEGDWMTKIKRVDFIGSLLILSFTTLSVLGLTWAGIAYPWKSPHVIATLCAGGSTAIIFLIWEGRKPKYPLLPLYIFRRGLVVGAAITQFINGYNSMVQVFYLPTFYTIAYGYSPVRSASILLSITVVQTVISTFAGLVITKTGRYREMIVLGWAIWAVGLGLMATMNQKTSLACQIGYSVLTGFGIGQTFQPSLVALQGAVDRKDMAVVTAMRSFLRNLGGTLGLAISGTVVNNVYSQTLREGSLDSDAITALIEDPLQIRKLLAGEQIEIAVSGYQRGFRIVFITLASLAGFSCITALLLMKHSTLKREDDELLRRQAKERLLNQEK